ncbi:hypothetical protein EJB05_28887, partial [Eragrostis curvula]
MRDLARRHGPVMLLRIGQVATVVVSSREAAREVMKTLDTALASRPLSPTISAITNGGRDIICAPYGDHWRQLRKIAVTELLSARRVLSFRRVREEEVAAMLRAIVAGSSSEQPVQLRARLTALLADITVRAVVGGERWSERDVFLRQVDRVNELAAGFNPADLWPSSGLVRRLSSATRRAEESRETVFRSLDGIIGEHLERMDRRGGGEEGGGGGGGGGEAPQDILDVLLRIRRDGGLQIPLDMDVIKGVIFGAVCNFVRSFVSPLSPSFRSVKPEPLTPWLGSRQQLTRPPMRIEGSQRVRRNAAEQEGVRGAGTRPHQRAPRRSSPPRAIVLQAREAVGTCVLARRWRDLWKSMPILRITGVHRVRPIKRFMDHLLLLRDRSNLDVCLLEFVGDSTDGGDYVKLWIRHALLCQVRKLSVSGSFVLGNLHLVSHYLTELHLDGVTLWAKCTDFSSCLALKDLEITNCIIDAEKICSRSLERLNLHECWFPLDMRTHISAPSLISLQLINFEGRTPFFEDMPVLVTTEVTFNSDCADSCNNNDPGYCEDASCDSCYGIDDGGAGSVLLRGFSYARNLKLIAKPKMFILKRDLRWCPTFHKLEILLLGEWCVADDHRALICILQHSLVLKKLTLQLYEKQKPKSLVPSKAIFNSVDESFASDNLERVEIKCHEVDQRIHNVLMSLVTYGIPLEKISIQQKNKSSQCFRFICTGFSSMDT